MRIGALTAIVVMTLTGGCGGSGGDASATLYAADMARFTADMARAESMTFADLATVGLTGSYLYTGRSHFRTIDGISTLSPADLADWVDSFARDDFITSPDIVASFDLTANFTTRTVGGRIYDFRTPERGDMQGALTLLNGVIRDEYFHYGADLQGRLGKDNTITDGLMVGDFIGSQGQMTLGYLGFTSGDGRAVGIFVGTR